MAEIKEALNKIEEPPFTKTQITEKLKNRPENIKPLSSQIAGHELAIFHDEKDGFVLKPIFDIRGVREETFYKLLFDSRHDEISSLTKLRSFIPTYINSTLINDVQYIRLSDLTLDFDNSSLMDVKIGARTYDRNATKEKIEHESSKDHLSRLYGFRVLALKKWIDVKQEFEYVTRKQGRDPKIDVKGTILFYFKQPTEPKTKELINSVIGQLNKIEDWFNNDNIDLFEFIGSSIFFIYSYKCNKLQCHVKMIDFAHIYPLKGSNINLDEDKKDNNYLKGLKSLKEIIEGFIKE